MHWHDQQPIIQMRQLQYYTNKAQWPSQRPNVIAEEPTAKSLLLRAFEGTKDRYNSSQEVPPPKRDRCLIDPRPIGLGAQLCRRCTTMVPGLLSRGRRCGTGIAWGRKVLPSKGRKISLVVGAYSSIDSCFCRWLNPLLTRKAGSEMNRWFAVWNNR